MSSPTNSAKLYHNEKPAIAKTAHPNTPAASLQRGRTGVSDFQATGRLLWEGLVMAAEDRSSRRNFMVSAGVASVSLLSTGAAAKAMASQPVSDDKPDRNPNAVLARLL